MPVAGAVQAGRSALGWRVIQLLVVVLAVTLIARGVGFPVLFALFVFGRRWRTIAEPAAVGSVRSLWVRRVEVSQTEVVVHTLVGVRRYPAAEVVGFEVLPPARGHRRGGRVPFQVAEVLLHLNTGVLVRLGPVRAGDDRNVETSDADAVRAIADLEQRRRAIQGGPYLLGNAL